VLRSIEQKIESLFEGVFGRAFRTRVQPVELARKLAKEMDEHRSISVSRIYVPNEYTVYLSPDDRAQFAGYEDSLRDELGGYLTEHAKRENYALLTSPRVLMETDDDLDVGEFGIATRMVSPGDVRAIAADAPSGEAEPGHTMIYKPPDESTQAATPEELGLGLLEREIARLAWNGGERRIEKRRVVIGRSRDCDIQLADSNVSRRHAELRQEGTAYWIVDLDSTNGIEVNGRRLKRAKLEDGDRVKLGATELVFHRERA
jgi:Protein of unknown function (DUF3662)/FHA domain